MLNRKGWSYKPDKIMQPHSSSATICVDGMRVPAHASALHNLGKIIALHCPREQRIDRSNRSRDIDQLDIDARIREEERESRNGNPFELSTLTVMEMADYQVDSTRPLGAVLHSVDDIVEPLLDSHFGT